MIVRLALRNLFRNRRRSALTVAALAVGVLSVVGVRGFLDGLQGSLIGAVTEGGVGAIQIHRAGFLRSREALPLAPDLDAAGPLIERVRGVPGVRAVAPRIPFAGMVAGDEETALAMFLGVDPADEAAVSPVRARLLAQGRWYDASGLVIGRELGRGLRLSPGAKVALISNDRDGVMNGVELTLDGTLDSPTLGEKKLVVLPLAKAQELLRMEGRATELAIAIAPGADVDRVAAALRVQLGADYEVHSWKQLATTADEARSTQDAALAIVTLAFLLVILMGIANTLLMNVLERTREIGTLVAIGMRRRKVVQLFVLEGVLLALSGALIGDLIGAGIVVGLAQEGIRFVTPGSSAPQLIVPSLNPWFLLVMLALSVLGAIVAALPSALRGARLDPVSALAGR